MSRANVPPWLRARLTVQAGGRCGYCRTAEVITGSPLVVDRLIPEALGGPTEEEKLWLACGPCNLCKSDRITARDPLSEDWIPLFDPRRQVWSEHFIWSTAGDRIIGITPTGRATERALQLNRPILVEARRNWVQAGWHPPDLEE
jgi:hypothetical protein